MLLLTEESNPQTYKMFKVAASSKIANGPLKKPATSGLVTTAAGWAILVRSWLLVVGEIFQTKPKLTKLLVWLNQTIPNLNYPNQAKTNYSKHKISSLYTEDSSFPHPGCSGSGSGLFIERGFEEKKKAMETMERALKAMERAAGLKM